jgi:hypothetical protein
MFHGFGRGFVPRGGMGFGFRGSSPPWPYVGIGRGGLPRCGYFLSGAAGAPTAWPYLQPTYPYYGATPSTFGYAPFAPQMSKEQELAFLKDQAGAIKEQLEQVEARVRELEGEK